MKEEIRQVLKMNKEGKITDEQAAELLAELANGKDESAAHGYKGEADLSRDWARSGLVEPIMSKVNDTLRHAMDHAFGWDGRGPGPMGHGGRGAGFGDRGFGGRGFGRDFRGHGFRGFPGAGAGGSNSVHMSRFDTPEGRDFVMEGNAFRMSSIKDMRLDRAELKDNVIDMSKVDSMHIADGKLIASEIRASSLDDWKFRDATAQGLSVQGSKVDGLHCQNGSDLKGVRIQGASLKDVHIDAGKLADTLINGTSAADWKWIRSAISDGEFQMTHLRDFTLADTTARNLMMRAMCVKGAGFTGCTLNDVVFTGQERWGWKNRGLKDARFENCNLEKVLFANCRITDVTLRNVNLKGRQFRDLDLSGLTLDGEEAFLKAAGVSA